MAANKSQAFIVFILNANVNEKDLQVAVWLIVDLTLLLRANHNYGIEMFIHGKQAFISLPKLRRKSLCYTSLPGMLDSLRRLHKYRGRTVRKRF